MRHVDGPDFICIGMGQAGTGWLYDQLSVHPDFWMPQIKEIRYLNQKVPKMGGAAKRLQRGNRRTGHSGKPHPLEASDRHVPETGVMIGGQPMDVAQYAKMFGMKGDRLTGDITPGYITLSESVIEQIATHLTHVKIVLLLRDPVSRRWSAICKRDRAGRFDESLLDDPERFRTFLDELGKAENATTKAIERWARIAPKMPFRYFFFDDLVTRPDWIRREILSYLGADSEKQSAELPAGYNRKAAHAKLELTPPIQAVLVDHLRHELRACSEQLGEHARSWPARSGV